MHPLSIVKCKLIFISIYIMKIFLRVLISCSSHIAEKRAPSGLFLRSMFCPHFYTYTSSRLADRRGSSLRTLSA